MKKNQITLIIIGFLILIGLIAGFSYWLGQKSVEVKSEVTTPEFLTSKVIQKWNAVTSGKVMEISDRTLTLSKEGDTLTILIREDASINRLLPPEEDTETPQPAVREEIGFEELKVGDEVNISCELKADGSLEGVDVMVSPVL